jgi:hypothetical protein
MQKTYAENLAVEAQFEARIDGTRIRFCTKLADNIQQTAALLTLMPGTEAEPPIWSQTRTAGFTT